VDINDKKLHMIRLLEKRVSDRQVYMSNINDGQPLGTSTLLVYVVETRAWGVFRHRESVSKCAGDVLKYLKTNSSQQLGN
jgi:hypothetical protein